MAEQRFDRNELGVGVIGCGRMGRHRARVASAHPAVRYLAVSDASEAQAGKLGEETGAHSIGTDNSAVIQDPNVTTVIVSTPESLHTALVMEALEAGKPVLVEKPLATDRDEALSLLRAAEERGVELRIGYSQRFKRGYFLAKRFIDEGKLGSVIGGTARVYNTQAHAIAILGRDPHVSPVVDVLTYYVDLIGWLMPDDAPVEVYSQGNGTILSEYSAYDGPPDISHALVRYASGATISYTISYAFPSEYPSMGQSPRLELLGTDGVLMLDEEGRSHIGFSEHGVEHAYVPGHTQKLGFLGTTSSGDWALGQMFGPIGDETRSWLDHLSAGGPLNHTTPRQAMQNLEITLAMEASAASGQPVKVELPF